MNGLRRRAWTSRAFTVACVVSVIAALVPLLLIVGFVAARGARALSPALFTQMPKPVGETGGGLANAMVGTLLLSAVASAFGVPVGVLSGLFAAEYRGTRLAAAMRFAADTLNGVPSIVIGVFVYAVAVLPFGHFSALAGGVALALVMVPIVMRTTEELAGLVPDALREGALALGATRARAVFTVVLPAALPGIVSGITLAVARIAGETAPLLFTSLGNQFFTTDVRQPMASLTVQVFTYAISPYADWQRQAWGGALVLIVFVFAASVAARLATRRLRQLRSH